MRFFIPVRSLGPGPNKISYEGVVSTPFFLQFPGREILIHEMIMSDHMPVLALRGLVVFPRQTVHFDVSREKSVKALDKAMERDQLLMLVPQKDIVPILRRIRVLSSGLHRPSQRR